MPGGRPNACFSAFARRIDRRAQGPLSYETEKSSFFCSLILNDKSINHGFVIDE
jgi:hypothetical protein